jgi:hypothetical protein
MTIIDGQDALLRGAHDLIAFRFHRAFANRRGYMRSGRPWFIGGSVHQDSALSPFVQTADLVAGVARHAIKKRKSVGTWYDKHLRATGLSGGREVHVSAHALRRLKTLDPRDSRGIAHSAAQVPP